MKFDEWLSTIPIQHTPEGARLDLRLYVHPDGRGNFLIDDRSEQVVNHSHPVNNLDEARDVLEKLWRRAMNTKAGPDRTEERATLASQLGDLIGSVPDLPVDMAEQHDHYLHGAPKK